MGPVTWGHPPGASWHDARCSRQHRAATDLASGHTGPVVPPPEGLTDPWRGDTHARDYRGDIDSATIPYMRIVSWVLTVLFVLVLAQTVFLLGGWLTAVVEASDGTSLPGFGLGFGDAFARLVLALILWCFARSARETVNARPAVPAKWHHGAAL